MPNNVRNVLTIVGLSKDIADFMEKVRGSGPIYKQNAMLAGTGVEQPNEVESLNFHQIVPVPQGLLERTYGAEEERRAARDAKEELSLIDGSESGHDWEHKNWGVKWGAYDQSEPIVEENRATYYFTTAWSSPVAFVEKASERWPNVLFVCGYGGEGPAKGRYAYLNGIMLHNEIVPYTDAPDIDHKNDDPQIYFDWQEEYVQSENHSSFIDEMMDKVDELVSDAEDKS